MRILLVAVVVLAPPCSGFAQSPPMVNVSAGTQSCGVWVTAATEANPSDADSVKIYMMESWVQGFLVGAAETTALLVGGNKTETVKASQAFFGTISGWAFDPPDSEAIKHWLTKYCREHPLDRVNDAALALYTEALAKSNPDRPYASKD